ncbi:YecR family lipoprotein [Shewanella sp. MF05960]|uniref:YecR family lipoprotein n=1 Tax=Shewanella sp. MF05960 TaxID=3434874 RepID=UPI003D7B3B52
MKIFLLSVLCSAVLMGCSSMPKQWTALDGSMSDGTITLTYVYRPFLDTKPILNNDELNLAISKCKIWGYSDASAFGEETASCHTSGIDGACTSWRVKKVYQCSVK